MRIFRIAVSCLSFWLLAGTLMVYAQQTSEERWHKGKIIRKNQDTLQGYLQYSLQNSLLQLKVNNTIKTFTASNVVSFLFFDKYYKVKRQFYSIPHARRRNSSYKVPTFFELIREGKPITLLSRQTSVIVRSNNFSRAYRRSERDMFYFVDNLGKLTEVKPTKRSIVRALSKRERAIKDFIKVNRVRLHTRSGLIKITDFYNSLVNK